MPVVETQDDNCPDLSGCGPWSPERALIASLAQDRQNTILALE